MSHAVTQPSSPVPPPAAAPAAAAPAAARPPAADRRHGSRWVALAAAVAAVGTVIGLVVTHPQHHRAPAHTATAPLTASYAFPAERYGNGLTVTRRWMLSGKRGSRLTETVIVANPAGKAVAVWFKDSIPDAATSNIKAIRFHPDSVKVLRADPVVEWYLRLPAHGTVTVGYVAVVAPSGATTARLEGWANGLDTIEKKLNTPAKKHPHPQTTPTPAYEPPTSTATSSAGNGNPNPYPTFACDPSAVTCTPSPASSSPGNGGF